MKRSKGAWKNKMAHSNSYPTLITVSQQMSQAHFQQSISTQMQTNSSLNSQIIFPQCVQPLSIQHSQNGSMSAVTQVNNNNNNTTQLQLQRSFQNQVQQHQSQLTIPVQLGNGNHAFTTTGIPLDLSYLVQGGCLPQCVPIQLTGPNGIQSSFQAAINCVNAPSPSQTETGVNNSFLQFANVSLSYPQCVPQTQTQTQPIVPIQKSQPKRKKKPLSKTDVQSEDQYQSVGVQTDFDMTLCRQQIVVVPPKNCTCGAVAEAVESGAFQAASFPPKKSDKKNKKIKIDHEDSKGVNISKEKCNGSLSQPSCDNRGRPFTYECIYCPKKFSLHSRLVAHLRCHTGMRPFSCLQCGYSFTQRSYLNRHAAVHKQERPFSCLACHKTYKHYGSLANHRKLHNKDSSEKSVTISESADVQQHLPASSTIMVPVTSQMIYHSSSSVAALPQRYIQVSSSNNTPHQYQPISSSTGPTNIATSQMYPLTSTGISSQLFPSSQQTIAAFYPGPDGQGFLLSLNPSSTSSSTTIANNAMLLQLHQPQYATSTIPNNNSSAYVPILSSPAFS